MEPGEDPQAALVRELDEEIGVRITSSTFFTRFTFDFAFAGQGVIFRDFFEVRLATSDLSKLSLKEGAGMNLFQPQTLVTLPKMTPYDAFALSLHMAINHERLRPRPS